MPTHSQVDSLSVAESSVEDLHIGDSLRITTQSGARLSGALVNQSPDALVVYVDDGVKSANYRINRSDIAVLEKKAGRGDEGLFIVAILAIVLGIVVASGGINVWGN